MTTFTEIENQRIRYKNADIDYKVLTDSNNFHAEAWVSLHRGADLLQTSFYTNESFATKEEARDVAIQRAILWIDDNQ